MKKILCAVLALVMLLSLAACGNKNPQRLAKSGTYYFGSEAGLKKLDANPNPLDPASVYSTITYTEQMLYGSFELENKKKNLDSASKKMSFQDVTYSTTVSFYTAEENLTTANLSSLPVEMEIGPACCYEARIMSDAYEWAALYLVNTHGTTDRVLCTYTVSGNTVSFAPLTAYQEIRNENGAIQQIQFTPGTETLDYTFAFSGVSLTLTRGGESITLKAPDFAQNGSSIIHIGGYAASEDGIVEDIDYMYGMLTDDFNTFYMGTNKGLLVHSSTHSASAVMNENGQLSLYWTSTDKDGAKVENLKHFIYFPGDGSTMTLTDGTNVYYYTESYSTRQSKILGQGMTTEEKETLNNMTEEEIEEIVQKKEDLLSDLAAAYKTAGLNVAIDTETGEIALDATVLFGVNESAISPEGQTFLQQFTQVYTSVVYSDAYADFISRVMVEGHTDTTGTYEHNLELSQARADSVKAYCLSEECGVDSAYLTSFGQSLEAVGYSWDHPIYDAEGNVDMDASRRVTFRFIIQLTQ